MKNLITRIFNPTRYWRDQFRHERALRIAADLRADEARDVAKYRLDAICENERSNASLRRLLASAYTLIGGLERDLQKAQAEAALFRVQRVRDERGRFTKEVVQ